MLIQVKPEFANNENKSTLYKTKSEKNHQVEQIAEISPSPLRKQWVQSHQPTGKSWKKQIPRIWPNDQKWTISSGL